ncbi:MAG: hypothetical protein NDJ92_00355 [Thermoanaerobaculia bacterium]|nr:hypothetical protein [Thermoanaerobaculia bacterium]
MQKLVQDRPVLVRWLLWLVAVAATVGAFMYQDKTGPTYPLEGELETAAGRVRFIFVRSETLDTELPILLVDPVPAGVTGRVEYRRLKSHDDWTVAPMRRGDFKFSRRGRDFTLSGIGVALPGLPERAGKYEMFVKIDDGSGKLVSVTGDRPVYARFKGAVPTPVLISHVLVIFMSMMFATRTVLEALVDGSYRWMLHATLVSLLVGAFLLGPLVQWYAFGVWWAGIPLGWDWTDNKVLVSLLAWGFAAWANRKGSRSRLAIYAAGVVTLLVYFIPHSIFGSEFDYRTGKGRGTVG